MIKIPAGVKSFRHFKSHSPARDKFDKEIAKDETPKVADVADATAPLQRKGQRDHDKNGYQVLGLDLNRKRKQDNLVFSKEYAEGHQDRINSRRGSDRWTV